MEGYKERYFASETGKTELILPKENIMFIGVGQIAGQILIQLNFGEFRLSLPVELSIPVYSEILKEVQKLMFSKMTLH